MKTILWLGILASPLLSQAQTAGGNCNAAMVTGSYSFVLTGRTVSPTNSTVAADFNGNGLAVFDGGSKVTVTITANTLQATGKQMSLPGTYTVASNCTGTVSLTSGIVANFGLVVWNSGANLVMEGADTTYAYAGTGTSNPDSCITASISGAYGYTATGFNFSATGLVTGASDEAGLMQFDGQGNITYSYTISGVGSSTQATATGTYTMTSSCIGTATLTDSNGKSISMNLSVSSANAASVDVVEASTGFIRTGTTHSTFTNPSLSIGNVASYAVSSTPPGSVFVIFGSNLATKPAGATTSTLPTTLLNTMVTVNGVAAPLFYVDQGQIDVQMPWDVSTGLATVVVKNGTSASNAAAVLVPATGTPGLSVYGNNRAVVVNPDGSVNSGTAGAAVGDEVVAYFTGGGPVTSTAKLVSGAPAPGSLAPVTGMNSVTVNGVAAKVAYMGLTPGSIGLYQANFFVPSVAKGSYPLVITIAGQASNNPLITVN